jgi:hypothetical protein
MHFRDLTGQRFGQLTVVERVSNSGAGKARWLCECNCEKQKTVIAIGSHLVSGHTKSCGCTRVQHGHAVGRQQSSEYIAWAHMLARVRNKTNPFYQDYGGRGITVCDRWNSFENFLADIGPKPSPEHSIDHWQIMMGITSLAIVAGRQPSSSKTTSGIAALSRSSGKRKRSRNGRGCLACRWQHYVAAWNPASPPSEPYSTRAVREIALSLLSLRLRCEQNGCIGLWLR